jgi:hypothetical protein
LSRTGLSASRLVGRCLAGGRPGGGTRGRHVDSVLGSLVQPAARAGRAVAGTGRHPTTVAKTQSWSGDARLGRVALRSHHVAVLVRVGEAAPEVERAGRVVRRLDLEQDPRRPAAPLWTVNCVRLAGWMGSSGKVVRRAGFDSRASRGRGVRSPRAEGRRRRLDSAFPTGPPQARGACDERRGKEPAQGRPEASGKAESGSGANSTSAGLAGSAAISPTMTKAGPERGTQPRSF